MNNVYKLHECTVEMYLLIAGNPERRHSAATSSQSGGPQRLVEQFSFEQLHSVMLNNNGNALSLYDEMSTMYEQLDVYKHAGSRQDRFTLLKLYNGSSWSRSFRSISVPCTAFKMSGFIQTAFLVQMLKKNTLMVLMIDNF